MHLVVFAKAVSVLFGICDHVYFFVFLILETGLEFQDCDVDDDVSDQ